MDQLHTPTRIIGYARVSTVGQDLDYQLERLRMSGCSVIFREKRSGKNTNDRPQLRKVLSSLREGDVLLATVADRVARDPLDMVNILESVKASGARLRLVDEPFIDTTTELADLFLYIYGWFARWQRLRILENTAHGRELARRRGVKFGRKPKLGPDQRQTAVERKANGESCAHIARSLGVSESTIQRLS